MMQTIRVSIIAAMLLLAGLTTGPARAAELLMFELEGCAWCQAWHREIGPIYPKTAEAQRAPLKRLDLFADRPPEYAAIAGVRFTPTFVLVHDGREIGRIEGYPGEDFFWALLGDLLDQLPNDASRGSGS